jgi:LAO/AO transport system kinase
MRRRPQDPEGFPKAMPVSALEGAGLAETWEAITTLDRWRRDNGHHAESRRAQAVDWMRREVEAGLLSRLHADPAIADLWPRLQKEVAAGALLPEEAARRLIEAFMAGK